MDHLLTEARNPASADLDQLSSLQIVQLMNAEDARVVPAVADQAENIGKAIDIITDKQRIGGRLIYVGAGTSGRLGVLDASECPPTFNSRPDQVVGLIAGGSQALTQAVEGAEDHAEIAVRDLSALSINSDDVVTGIATSGRTPYVLGAMRFARRCGAATIGIACTPDSEIAMLVDIAITVSVGPEIVTGSTRLKAGTATKLVLNMLTTGTMVRLGKTFGNLMVDLRATNSKLRARTNRIIRLLTGLPHDEAAELLRLCEGELKTALVVQLANIGPTAARERLRAANGQVRQALAKPASREQTKSAHDLILGVDGGGTNTVALLGRFTHGGAWTVLGRGTAGPSNYQAVGFEKACWSIRDAVEGAFANASISQQTVQAACLGLAGAGRREDQNKFQLWAQRAHLAERVEWTTDGDLIVAAGTPNAWGVAIVAGTGSIVVGRAMNGTMRRAGGWGYLLGDEGSGYALTMSALKAVARAADGRTEATQLRERFLHHFQLAKPEELIAVVYGGTLDRAALAALAPLVLETAATDAAAASIVEHEAAQLARAALAVARNTELVHQPFPLALAGGLMVQSDWYRHKIVSAIRTLQLFPDPINVVSDPAIGAIKIAQQIATAPDTTC